MSSVTANTEKLCESCRREPATAVNQWTGHLVGERCARISSRIQTDTITVQNIESVLRNAVTEDGEDYTGYQSTAIELIAELLVYQTKRIADLEAVVAKLTKENS
jgi:hypothetical protein